MFSRGILLLILLIAALFPGSASAIDIKAEKAKLETQFKQTDADGDNKISRDEYLARKGDKKVLERDFKLFDFDENSTLSRAEFSVTPGTIHPSLRGPVPDPFDNLLNAALGALDQSNDNWSENPEKQVQSQQFVIDFLSSISTNGIRTFDASLVSIADENRNNQVDWEEAKRFLEIMLGIRSPEGQHLRESTGRVLVYHRFVWYDANKDQRVTLAEYQDKVKGAEAKTRFENGDTDRDGAMTLSETANPDWYGYFDPILEFRKADADLDGLVSRGELQQALPDYRKPIVDKTFPAFDGDGDDKITLDEFRISMAGNNMAPWESPPTDKNRDNKLTVEEFIYANQQCRLLWRYYVFRFDANGDNELTFDEYAFKKIPPQMLHRMTLDGNEFAQLYVDEEYPFCGSPAVSPDGKSILFDSFPPAGIGQARVFQMTIDGKNVRDLGPSLMPTWSPDGKQFASTRNDEGRGVWIMKIDGTPDKRIDDGWGAQWSPDGSMIAYTKGNTIWSYDVASEETREVLSSAQNSYGYIYYNMAWTPDSSRLLFRAYKKTQAESDLASISMTEEKPDLKVHLTTDRNPDADMAWFPDGKHVLVTMQSPEHGRRLPHKWNIESGEDPVQMPGIDTNLNYGGVTISPDGKWIIMATSK